MARRQASVEQGGDDGFGRATLPSSAGRRGAGLLPFSATAGGVGGVGRDGSAQDDP